MREHRTANWTLVIAAAAAGAFAAPAAAETIVILTGDHEIAVMDTESQTPVPESAVHPITGLVLRDEIVSIDTHPTTGVLYGFARDRLYTIDAATGVATLAGPKAGPLFPTAMDFDPVSGLLQMVDFRHAAPSRPDGAALAKRLDPRTMRLPPPDPASSLVKAQSRVLAYAPGDPAAGSVPQVRTIAHDPSASGVLYGVDSARNTLVRIETSGLATDPEDAQLVHTVAPLTGLLDGATLYALEITSDGTALALTGLPWRASVSRIDLTTGEATALRGVSDPIDGAIYIATDLAVAPTAEAPATSALDVRRARVRTNYSRPTAYESIEVRGSIPSLPDGVAGTTLLVDAGGARGEFTIRRSGTAAWVGVAQFASIRLNSVRLRGGERRIDFVLRMQPNRGYFTTEMEDMPGGLGPFVSYVGLFFDDAAFVATTEFRKVAKRFGSR